MRSNETFERLLDEQSTLNGEQMPKMESMEDYAEELEASFRNMRKVETEVNYAWEKLRMLQEAGKTVSAQVVETKDAGVVVMVDGIRGFIPVSRLAAGRVEKTDEYMGRTLEALIREVDEEENRLILSVKELLREKELEEKKEKVSRVTAGSVLEGTVAEIKDYGAFVDIGDGVTGLLHISEISTRRVKNVRTVLSVGQTVQVQVLKVADGKVSLSMKSLMAAEEAKKEAEERAELESYVSEGDATTGLGALLKNIKL